MQESKAHEFVDYWHVQELGGLELLKASYHETEFSKHTHEGYCIGLIDEGAQSFLRTGHQHIAPKGDIILVNADEVHTGSSAVDSGWCYRAIYPTPEMMADISRDFFKSTGSAPWFPHAVVHDEGLAIQLNMLFDLLIQSQNSLFKESLFLSTTAYLISRHAMTRQTLKNLPEAQRKIQLIQEILAHEPEKEHQLSDLAEIVGLSPWHLLRQFKKYTGLPPHAWLVQCRLHKALRLLKSGQEIALTAQLCGFSDQSHFNRHFKKAVGCTPAQYMLNF
ncbi:AraC family transcriptional regulator [Acinetobacter sp. ANC 5054]|uniref:AraC family transcriptional regulator n=1 Tax=Acinetobacter sp. ANC 5054 TaxID=1977877 RepID=UPI000A349D3A|nr:AraC family transcriptional regulator [Acinetobacter sp. ANC 5054]OTG83427.1 AraC family transcriptional regulator [Acinetobacter sp. ANC 5054]